MIRHQRALVCVSLCLVLLYPSALRAEEDIEDIHEYLGGVYSEWEDTTERIQAKSRTELLAWAKRVCRAMEQQRPPADWHQTNWFVWCCLQEAEKKTSNVDLAQELIKNLGDADNGVLWHMQALLWLARSDQKGWTKEVVSKCAQSCMTVWRDAEAPIELRNTSARCVASIVAEAARQAAKTTSKRKEVEKEEEEHGIARAGMGNGHEAQPTYQTLVEGVLTQFIATATNTKSPAQIRVHAAYMLDRLLRVCTNQELLERIRRRLIEIARDGKTSKELFAACAHILVDVYKERGILPELRARAKFSANREELAEIRYMISRLEKQSEKSKDNPIRNTTANGLEEPGE